MIKKIFFILVGVLVVFAGVVAMQPAEFKVERSASFNAAPQAVFENVNNLHKWEQWSPWAKIDPAAKQTYEGPEAGVGAMFSWSSENSEVGVGRMTITESRANELIKMRLDFVAPMQATNTTEFAFKQNGNQTVVTWSMSGNKNFIMKAFGLFMNCDKMVGDYFEKGLAQLRTVAESAKQA